MLPGKTYTPESVLLILKRRFWLLLVPLAIVSAVTAVVARRLPDIYQSRATIVVTPQQVSESYVRSTISTALSDRLPTMSQKILSRSKLESIIAENNLYAEERAAGELMDDTVDRMRRDIAIQPLKADAFIVGYQSRLPQYALKVSERLANLFRDENLIDRESTANATKLFLDSQLDEAKGNLVAQEKRLQKYREEHAGQMPTQAERNMLALQNTWQNIQATVESSNRDKERRLVLERQLADLTAETPADAPTPLTLNETDINTPASVPGGTAQQLQAYQNLLAQLEQRGLTPEHPDVARVKRLIAGLQQKADAEALQSPVSTTDTGPKLSPVEQARQAKVEGIRADIAQIDEQIAAKQAEEGKLRPVAVNLQSKIDGVPRLESEMVDMMRDYTTFQTVYQNLLAKKLDSRISANLEAQERGEQFKVIESPRLPQKPISPDRQRMNLTGMAMGLGFGFALIVLLEYRDSSFNNDDEVTRLLSLPVLAVVPVMQSNEERNRRGRRRMLVSLGLGTTVAGCLAVVLYTLVR